MSGLIFLKLGGSLITDKTGVEQTRPDVISRLAGEIVGAWQTLPALSLLIGHGSGSFGHVAAAKHGTRQGVQDASGWVGFTNVAAAAARLNRIVVEALVAAGMPAFSVSPSGSGLCEDGVLVEMAAGGIERGINAGIFPVTHGDVIFDRVRGGTIASTEEVMAYLAPQLKPAWLLLAGEVQGVLDANGQLISRITPENFGQVQTALGGSRGTDVTGGMSSKVQQMMTLCQQHPGLRVRIFSGLEPGLLQKLLLKPDENAGTLITA